MNLSKKSTIRGRFNGAGTGTVLYCPFMYGLNNYAVGATEPHPHSVVGSAITMTANKGKFSGRAPLFNTSGKLQYTSSVDWALGNTFSIRYWAKQLNYINAYYTHMCIGTAVGRKFRIRRHGTVTPGFTVSVGGTDFFLSYVFDTVNVWKLFEFVIANSEINLYVDHSLVDTVGIGSNSVSQDVLYVGGNDATEWYNGYMQHLSIHKGIAIK